MSHRKGHRRTPARVQTPGWSTETLRDNRRCWRTKISHRVPPGLQQSQLPRAAGRTWDGDGGVLAGWGAGVADEVSGRDLHGLVLTVSTQVDCRAVSEQDDDAVLPGIVLWRRYVCAEQHTKKSLEKNIDHCLEQVYFKLHLHFTSNLKMQQQNCCSDGSRAVLLYRHIPGRRSRPRTKSWDWHVAPALAGCLSCRSRDFHRSRGHTSWASSV